MNPTEVITAKDVERITLRVLYLEDNPKDAELVESKLGGMGFDTKVTRAESEPEFLAALDSGDYDLLLSDYNLPGFDGMVALEIAQKKFPQVPFIFISGTIGEDMATEALKRGATDYVLKHRLSRLPLVIDRAVRESKGKKQRLQAEEMLRHSEEKYRKLFTAMREGFALFEVICDERAHPSSLRFLEVNSAFAEAIELKPEDIVGKTGGELIPSLEALCIRNHGRVGETDASVRLESYAEELGKYFEVIAFAPKTGQIATILLDITERKRSEEQLRKLSHAVEQSPVSVMITDNEGKIEYINPRVISSSGYSREELLGQSPSIFKSGEMSPDVYEGLWNAITSGQNWQGEFCNRKKNGDLYWEYAIVAPIRNPSGEISHFIALKEDITERKRLEAQYLQAQKMEAVGRLAGGVAHDFNNLLTAILGYSELLLDKLDQNNSMRSDLEEIQKAGERASQLTSQLLAFSRKQVMAPRLLNLNDLIMELSKMLKRLIGEDITLNTALDPALNKVKADPGQLEQIILNLVVNSRDAMPQGGKLTIETAMVELDESYARSHLSGRAGSYVMLAVSDTGVGMNAETRAHIFEPFFTTKEKGKGTGLGLATVFGIVKQNQGYIWVYSEPGCGTSFKIYLPEAAEVMEPILSPKEPSLSPRGSETILLAEDSADLRQLICRGLVEKGYVILEAPDGHEALRIAKQHPGEIHLLMSDVIMPGLGGSELARRVSEFRPAIKVLFMSGYTDGAIAHHSILDPDTAFLQKPFTPNTLARKVREVLDRP